MAVCGWLACHNGKFRLPGSKLRRSPLRSPFLGLVPVYNCRLVSAWYGVTNRSLRCCEKEPLTRDRVPTQFHNMIWGPSLIMENPKFTASLYCLCVLEYRHNDLKGLRALITSPHCSPCRFVGCQQEATWRGPYLVPLEIISLKSGDVESGWPNLEAEENIST